ncbi:peptide chain release factor N(5)-glutamine methyltransferase [Chlamydiota bacterium]
MITLLEIIKRSEKYLAERGIESPRRSAEEVIADALSMKRLDLYLQFDRPLTESELPALRSAIQRRAHHEPTAYIAGKVTFAGIELKVDKSVLIPRPETEIMVETIAQTLQGISLEDKILWDMCCGSGCIGLALKARFPKLTVVLSDIRPEALKTAQLNSQNDIQFKQGDLFTPFAGESCDFFVCNPPYISEEEFSQLTPEVREWEPKRALVSGPTGLECYVRIAKELRSHLKPGGLAWLEIGSGQGKAVQALFESQGWRCRIELDWAGHDRFCFLS